MRVGVMQPYFFPYIGYWQLINYVDVFVIFDDVNYINRGWINRNRIILNGGVHYINLPVVKASQNKKINELQVDISRIQECLNRIEAAYRKAPYYSLEYGKISEIISQSSRYSVSEILESYIRSLCDYLSISSDIRVSSMIEKDNTLKGEEKIIDICKRIGADEYVNPIGGVELYHKEKFDEAGIELSFLKSRLTPYKQFDDTFISSLSVVDVLMFCGCDMTKKMLDDYDIVRA